MEIINVSIISSFDAVKIRAKSAEGQEFVIEGGEAERIIKEALNAGSEPELKPGQRIFRLKAVKAGENTRSHE